MTSCGKSPECDWMRLCQTRSSTGRQTWSWWICPRSSCRPGERNAPWTALHVITPDRLSLAEAEQDRINSTLHLAEEMDSHALTLAGSSVAETVIEYAREHNVTKIVVGQSQEPRWRRLLRASVVEKIMQAG